ncbi:hypothetical protein LCGC14_0359170 [marine sediment metagenome]|uniref:Uncharacterized protein n=1 Tax=marine sediment metagenome TaxID=412755 RepID=A0A0F9TRD2_9ZZZZ|nr:hypothetical protein [Candidatus Aminicenantes bacterium]
MNEKENKLLHAVLFPDECFHEFLGISNTCKNCNQHMFVYYRFKSFARDSEAFWDMKEKAEEQEWYDDYLFGKGFNLEKDFLGTDYVKTLLIELNPKTFPKLLSDFIRDMVLRERDNKCPECHGQGQTATMADMINQVCNKCDKCKGTGKRWHPDIVKLAEELRVKA